VPCGHNIGCERMGQAHGAFVFKQAFENADRGVKAGFMVTKTRIAVRERGKAGRFDRKASTSNPFTLARHLRL
jgi:hypothetical protein